MKHLLPLLTLLTIAATCTGVDAQTRGSMRERVRATFPQLPIVAMSPGEAAAVKPMMDCVVEGSTEAILASPKFRSDPEGAIARLRSDWKTEFARLEASWERTERKCGMLMATQMLPIRDVADVVLDYASLKEAVLVRGYFRSAGDLNFLYDAPGSNVFVMLDVSELPREDRKKLLKECSKGCPLRVLGFVQDVLTQKGMKVRGIE